MIARPWMIEVRNRKEIKAKEETKDDDHNHKLEEANIVVVNDKEIEEDVVSKFDVAIGVTRSSLSWNVNILIFQKSSSIRTW